MDTRARRDGDTAFYGIRDRINVDLDNIVAGASGSEDGSTEILASRSPLIEGALDSADGLYYGNIAEQTGESERILGEMLMEDNGDHLRAYVYDKLYSFLGRNVITYRTLDSLDLYESKKTFYKSESDIIKERVRERRENAYTRMDEEKARIDAGYIARLDALIAGTIEEYFLESGTPPEPVLDKETIEAIRVRLDEFEPYPADMGRTTDFGEFPSMDSSWLNEESKRLELYKVVALSKF